jgi:hypothetical protein
MELAHHAKFDVATALTLRIKVFWVDKLESMAFTQNSLNP